MSTNHDIQMAEIRRIRMEFKGDIDRLLNMVEGLTAMMLVIEGRVDELEGGPERNGVSDE